MSVLRSTSLVSLPIRALLAWACATSLGAAERGSLREEVTLDGTWEIAFDPANQGREARWHHDDIFRTLPGRRPIAVPSAWELSEKDYEGVAFYRREFEVPAAWSGRVVRLQFGAVNCLSEVWLNGSAVGYHEGGFTPFEFRVDQVLKPGKANVLILRVVGPIVLSGKVVDGVGPLETPQWRGGLTGGVWQSVKLVATGDVVVQEVFLVPDLADGTATLQVALDHTTVAPKDPAQAARFAQLNQFVEAGGTAVYLEGAGGVRRRGRSNQIKSEALPLSGTVEAAQGLWTCIPHLVRPHPIFAGLPAGGMMRNVYENVWATQTLRDLGGEAIVASIGFAWFSDDHKLHYSGPGESWWGADLAVVPHGQGRIIVSQLRLVGNLGKDPVADRILFNLLNWTAGGAR